MKSYKQKVLERADKLRVDLDNLFGELDKLQYLQDKRDEESANLGFPIRRPHKAVYDFRGPDAPVNDLADAEYKIGELSKKLRQMTDELNRELQIKQGAFAQRDQNAKTIESQFATIRDLRQQIENRDASMKLLAAENLKLRSGIDERNKHIRFLEGERTNKPTD